MTWLRAFIADIARANGRSVASLFREAFCARYGLWNRYLDWQASDGERLIGGEVRQRPEYLVVIPDSMDWLTAAVEREVESADKSPGALFREAFCEHFGAQNAALKKQYDLWKLGTGVNICNGETR